MKPLPTDLEILNEIFEQYYDVFSNYSEENPAAGGKTYVAIDIEQIAKSLGVDEDIVFGRLYYHLDRKFGYTKDQGRTSVPFFTQDIEPGAKHVHFPYLASVLADLRADDKRHRTSNSVAIWALIISVIAIAVTLFTS